MTSTMPRSTATTAAPPVVKAPSTGRAGRRNPARVASGVLVLSLCTVGAMSLYQRANQQVSVLQVARDVPAGRAVRADDLAVISVPADAGVRSVNAAERDTTIGRIADVGLVDGALLHPDQLRTGPAVPDGKAIAGATLDAGRYPLSLRAGDRVRLLDTGTQDDGTQTAAAPRTLGVADVLEVQPLTTTDAAVAVTLRVDEATAGSLAGAAANQRLAVVQVGAS